MTIDTLSNEQCRWLVIYMDNIIQAYRAEHGGTQMSVNSVVAAWEIGIRCVEELVVGS